MYRKVTQFYISISISIYVCMYICSVAKAYLTLCDPMDCRTPGFPVFHHLLSLLKLTSTESMMSSNHLILCCPLLFLSLIFPSIRVYLWVFGDPGVKTAPVNAEDLGSIPGSRNTNWKMARQPTLVFLPGRSHVALRATVHGITKNQTQLRD